MPQYSLGAGQCKAGCLGEKARFGMEFWCSLLCFTGKCAVRLQLISLLWILQLQRNLGSQIWYSGLGNYELSRVGMQRITVSSTCERFWSGICPAPKVNVVSLYGHLAVLFQAGVI